jgi:hypothetical protein
MEYALDLDPRALRAAVLNAARAVQMTWSEMA